MYLSVSWCVQVFGEHVLFTSLESALELEILGQMVVLCVTVREAAGEFSNVAALFHCSQS